jgi:hypothetical protein
MISSFGWTAAPLLAAVLGLVVLGKRFNDVQQRLEAVEEGVTGLQVDVARLRLTGAITAVDAREALR